MIYGVEVCFVECVQFVVVFGDGVGIECDVGVLDVDELCVCVEQMEVVFGDVLDVFVLV